MPDFKKLPSVNGTAVALAGHIHPDDPDEVSGAGLLHWLQADAITGLANSAPVATWADISGNGVDITQATAGNRPLYKTGILNGHAVVRFDGTDDVLASAVAPGGGGTLAQPFTYVFVHKFSSTAGSPRIFGTSTVIWVTGGNYAMYGGAILASSTPTDAATWHIVTAVWNGASSALYRDGLQIAAGNAGTDAETILKVGSDGVNAFPGDIAEAVIYDHALTTTERVGVENALAAKYGLTVAGTLPTLTFAWLSKWGTD